MKIVITGSKGFIGSYLVNTLKKEYSNIIGWDKEKNSPYDLFDIDSLKGLIEGADIVIHLAGLNRAEDNELLMVNVLGTLNILEAIRRYSKNTKIIFSSSFQVYQPTNKPIPINEDQNLKPESVYGYTKKLSEDLIKNYSDFYGIKSIILRFSNVYGPNCKPNYNSVISTFCYNAVNNLKLSVNNKDSSRDFIFIDDVIDAVKKSIKFDAQFEVFNICSGELSTLQDIINILKNEKKIDIEYGNERNYKYLLGSYSKAENLLKFRPQVKLKEGIKKTLKWFENVN